MSRYDAVGVQRGGEVEGLDVLVRVVQGECQRGGDSWRFRSWCPTEEQRRDEMFQLHR